jgi:hypothetical protein
LNGVNPLAYITELLNRPQDRIDELMPWYRARPNPH